jgi:hypothetical protein
LRLPTKCAQPLTPEQSICTSTGGGPATTDIFTVSLLDADTATLDPLISYVPEVPWFYYLDNDGVELTVPSASVVDNMVTLDVSSFAGRDVRLAFNLLSASDGKTTNVAIDNVNVTVTTVPAPGALILALIGTATVGLIRRLKQSNCGSANKA